jgi:hypothetical protein
MGRPRYRVNRDIDAPPLVVRLVSEAAATGVSCEAPGSLKGAAK